MIEELFSEIPLFQKKKCQFTAANLEKYKVT